MLSLSSRAAASVALAAEDDGWPTSAGSSDELLGYCSPFSDSNLLTADRVPTEEESVKHRSGNQRGENSIN